jgi:hypothetical protein
VVSLVVDGVLWGDDGDLMPVRRVIALSDRFRVCWQAAVALRVATLSSGRNV